jgi:lipopolysaccharide export system permease protein
MKKINIFTQISLLERYLISQLITPLLFSIVIVTVVAESIGISFEQFRFLIEEKLSFDVLIYLHILKLPEFIIYSLPIATLMATIFTYQKLSENSEITALQNKHQNIGMGLIGELEKSMDEKEFLLFVKEKRSLYE